MGTSSRRRTHKERTSNGKNGHHKRHHASPSHLSVYASSDDSTNAVSKISFYVDITYRILLCFWFLYTGCCYVKNRLCNCARWWSDDLNNVNHLPQNIAHSDHSVEEESPSLNTPAGNALTHNNLFIRFSDDVNPHGHCQKLSDEFHNFHQYAPYEPRLFYQQCQ